jgi:transposase
MDTNEPYRKLSPEAQLKARVEAIKELKKGVTPTELACRYGVSRQTIYTWKEKHEEDPRKGLLAGQRGAPSYLSPEQLRQLRLLLLAGAAKQGYPTDLWTVERVRQTVKKVFGVEYADGSVRAVLAVLLDFSYQKPERRAKERDEKAIATWKQRFRGRKKKR